MKIESYKFQIPSPKDLASNKKLSDLKLKLTEYSDKIKYDESVTGVITIEMQIPQDYNKDELGKLINSFSYLGHN